MPSPFPGMDPYLERHWLDVHARLVTYAADALNGVLPPDLIARTEERLVVESIDPSHLETEERATGYISILETCGEKPVTIVELLNAGDELPGPSREQYRRRRDELMRTKVNLVEIELTRHGPWRELLAPFVAPPQAHTAYRAIVRRFHPVKRVELYPISLRVRLPVIPVPLRATDRDVTLDLQRLIEQVYDNGRYDRTDYTRGCSPPLDREDAAWAEELLKAAGGRGT